MPNLLERNKKSMQGPFGKTTHGAAKYAAQSDARNEQGDKKC